METGLLLLTLFILFIFPIAGLVLIFRKAGQKGLLAIIPIVNMIIWLRIIQKPMWWIILFFIPLINWIVFALMYIETLRHFGINKIYHALLSAPFFFIYLPIIGFRNKYQYIEDTSPEKGFDFKKWGVALIGTILLISVLQLYRGLFYEPFTVPTTAMEGTILTGDYVYTSKLAVGPRLPITPISIPNYHHTIPWLNINSFSAAISFPYLRLFGSPNVKRNDIIIFNYPEGDSVSDVYQSNISYYRLVKEYGRETVLKNHRQFGDIIYRPVDKREHYIKRCIGLPGETLEIKDGQVYINEESIENPPTLKFGYYIDAPKGIGRKLRDEIGITEEEYNTWRNYPDGLLYFTKNQIELLDKKASSIVIEKVNTEKGVWRSYLFPFDENFKWNPDNYGPIYIPEKGNTIKITKDNLPLFRRIIEVYENNEVNIVNNAVYINLKKADNYTFKMNYYWMMGDNRHNSADSRYWGFVPEDHIVGMAFLVVYSKGEHGLRKGRFMKHIN